MSKVIYFDMDGTVYNFYHRPDWLERLMEEDETLYTSGGPLVPMDELARICIMLKENGWTISVCTWLTKNVSRNFLRRTEQIKRQWVRRYMPYVDNVYVLGYGVKKQNGVPRAKEMVLIDDNAEVRKMWDTPRQRWSIDASRAGWIQELEKLSS